MQPTPHLTGITLQTVCSRFGSVSIGRKLSARSRHISRKARPLYKTPSHRAEAYPHNRNTSQYTGHLQGVFLPPADFSAAPG